MKAIVEKSSLPAFLKVIQDIQQKRPFTRYLLHPLKGGELVKVAPWEEQVSTNLTPEQFRRRYVKVIRKDADGKWSLAYVLDWGMFESLKRKS